MKLEDVAQLLPRTDSFDVWIYAKSQVAWVLPDVKTRIYDMKKPDGDSLETDTSM